MPRCTAICPGAFLTIAAAGLGAVALAEWQRQPVRTRVLAGVLAVFVWGAVAGLPAWRGGMGRKYWNSQSVAFERSQDFALPVYAQVNDPREALQVGPSPDGNVDAVVTAGTGRAQVRLVVARRIDLHTECESDCTVRIGQFYYPAWQARLMPASTAVPLKAAVPGGLMEIALPRGEHEVALDFAPGWSERVGPWVSVLALALAGLIALTDRRDVGRSARTTAAESA